MSEGLGSNDPSLIEPKANKSQQAEANSQQPREF